MKDKKKHTNKAIQRKAVKPAKGSYRNKPVTLAPLSFDQAVDCLLNTKPKKAT